MIINIFFFQNNRICEEPKTGIKESENISLELASAINDGLYFYEQVNRFIFILLYFNLIQNFKCLIFGALITIRNWGLNGLIVEVIGQVTNLSTEIWSPPLVLQHELWPLIFLLRALGVKCQEMQILEGNKIEAFPRSSPPFTNNGYSQAILEIMEVPVVLLASYQKVRQVIQLAFSLVLLHQKITG